MTIEYFIQILHSTLENDKAVEEVLSSKGKQQTDLISKMLEDEKYQREAFQALLLQQDHRALEITDQMSMIQNELAALTVVEMKKRDMKVTMATINKMGNGQYHFSPCKVSPHYVTKVIKKATLGFLNCWLSDNILLTSVITVRTRGLILAFVGRTFYYRQAGPEHHFLSFVFN